MTTKLDPAIKQKWIEALRSGKYKQGEGRLKKEERGVKKYCCLGVLNEICNLGNADEASYLEGADNINLRWVAQEQLANLNDRKKFSFEQIADWIEENL